MIRANCLIGAESLQLSAECRMPAGRHEISRQLPLNSADRNGRSDHYSVVGMISMASPTHATQSSKKTSILTLFS